MKFNRQTEDAQLNTVSGKHRLTLRMANTFFARLRGLMLSPALGINHGMLLTKCRSVHTCFMREPLDLVYLDENGVATRCVANLQPWRSSTGRGKAADGMSFRRAAHVLELASGSIALLGIETGNKLDHTMFSVKDDGRQQRGLQAFPPGVAPSHARKRQSGSAMIEFAIVAPMITLLGLATIQYGLMYFAKNQYNHAAFMAARAGSMANANLDEVKKAYIQALVPIHGGGTNAEQLTDSYNRAEQATSGNIEIVMLNPTAESFADFNDPALQKKLGLTSQRVIPNGGLAFKKQAIVQANSGQNVQDANLLKLRITYGYKPQVPLVGNLYLSYLKWMDPGKSDFHTQRIKTGYIPIVSNITMQMQSDVIEGITVSTPGPGNGGTATNAGSAPSMRNPPPDCTTLSCTDPIALEGSSPTPVNTGSASPGATGPAESTVAEPTVAEPTNPEPTLDGTEPNLPGTGDTIPGGPCTALEAIG